MPATRLVLLLLAFPTAASALQQPDPPITGKADSNLASFDRMMVAFLKKHQVPGATLAVTKDGRLVYARGFGFADLDKQQPMEAHSQFASCCSTPAVGPPRVVRSDVLPWGRHRSAGASSGR